MLYLVLLSDRGLDNKINHLHEKDLRIVYKDKLSDFKTKLKNDVTIHVKEWQCCNDTR